MADTTGGTGHAGGRWQLATLDGAILHLPHPENTGRAWCSLMIPLDPGASRIPVARCLECERLDIDWPMPKQ